MKWSEENIKTIKEMYKNKASTSEISTILGKTPKAIKNKAYILGITNPVSFTEEEKQYVKDHYKSYNLKEIAITLGREKNYRNVCRLARKLGLDRTGKKKENPQGYRDENGLYHKNGWIRKTPEQTAETKSKIMKEWHKNNEHPKGMLGKHHSKEYSEQIRKRVNKYWEKATPEEIEKRRIKQTMTKIKNGTLDPNKNKNPYSRARGGKREDLNNQYFRSMWEANIARYYNFVGIKWEYEPKTFIFPDIKRGCVSYTPDFYLPEENRWVEVKGWMDDKSKTKLKRFAKYYPDEYKRLEIIQEKEYKEFKKYSTLIPGWE